MEVEVEKAVEIHTPEGHQLALIALWKDGHVTVCAIPEEEKEKAKAKCYTSRRPEGETLYYIAQAYFSGLGHKVVKIEGEAGKEESTAAA
jgi:hypothetical protein